MTSAATATPSAISTALAEVDVLQDVRRQHQHHGGRRHADEEGEVRDVQAPAHVIAHAR